MWDILTDDMLDIMATVGSVQMLACMRRLEKRCTAIARAKVRLDDCSRLMMPPFCVPPAVILGFRPMVNELALNNKCIGHNDTVAFAAAVGSGSLPALQFEYLSANPGSGAPVRKALVERKKGFVR